MGIRSLDLQALAKTMAAAGIVYKDSTMLEMGDQMFSGILSGKEFFTERDVDHTSIDWNGNHGALQKDLAEPLDLGEFDIVTNFGTAEHVSNQRVFFRNMHSSCRPGGIMVHTAPIYVRALNKSHGIGRYGFSIRYSQKFFRDLAKDNHYEMVHWRDNGWLGYVGFVMPTGKEPFKWRH